MPEPFRVVLSSAAQDDLVATTRYIDYAGMRERYIGEIIGRMRRIARYPMVFRERRLPSGRRYRAITYKSHIFFYRVDEAAGVMFVVRIFHGGQDYASEL